MCVAAGVRALELLLGAESGYLREILTEELAKGLDAFWRISADDALDAARASLVSTLGVSNRTLSFEGIRTEERCVSHTLIAGRSNPH